MQVDTKNRWYRFFVNNPVMYYLINPAFLRVWYAPFF